jgi:predicted nucleic acid-binding protein
MEYEELLMRFYSIPITYNLLNFIINSTHTKQVIPYYKWNLIEADDDDNKFVDCALNSGADYIVTNDRHFNVLKSLIFPSINVIDLEKFKEMISKKTG